MTRSCSWCDPAKSAGAAGFPIVWQHPVQGCWCEAPGARNDRCHLSWTCADHADRERRDLHDLGFSVMAWVPQEHSAA